MAKPAPHVIGILVEPTPATWWRKYRHRVYGILGLAIGFTLASGGPHLSSPTTPAPRPTHSTPAPSHPTAPSSATTAPIHA
ncbi:hypothetical protein ABZ721_33125 [Streptomyces sp. NPDC006733]|uniref:hypothetical protein n=1 Tax=Streptomyces sp. NPDC006733 TaxID=3155460 RepID=UPI0033D5C43C